MWVPGRSVLGSPIIDIVSQFSCHQARYVSNNSIGLVLNHVGPCPSLCHFKSGGQGGDIENKKF